MAVESARISTLQRDETRTEAWWIFPTGPLLAAAIAFTWTLHGELQRLYGMTGSAWDFGYDQQVIWNISQGQGFYTSFARANFLGIHFELIFVLLAAVEKFWPSPIPFWAAIQEAARDFFHPENMALALALLAAWAGIRGHRVAMWLFCLIT